MLMNIAVCRDKKRTGIRKVKAKKNFAAKVEIVDSQISLLVLVLSDSSEICIPKASEKASAMAIVNIPPITAGFEFVPALNPTIKPSVVMIPDVIPKKTPILSDCFMLERLFLLIKEEAQMYDNYNSNGDNYKGEFADRGGLLC